MRRTVRDIRQIFVKGEHLIQMVQSAGISHIGGSGAQQGLSVRSDDQFLGPDRSPKDLNLPHPCYGKGEFFCSVAMPGRGQNAPGSNREYAVL